MKFYTRRRFFLSYAYAGPLMYSAPVTPQKPTVVVIGAGAFGGWAALELQRSGVKVILVDAWGPGNSRASSGGETRIIRATYGPDKVYTQLAADALHSWKENQQRWKRKLFYQTGAIWMAGPDDTFERSSLTVLREAGVPFERVTPAECAQRWPQIDFSDVSWAIYEPMAGYLTARRACEAVYDAFIAEGGEYLPAKVLPGPISRNEMQGVMLNTGSLLRADSYVFACGPWLPKLFPFLSPVFRVTRQEVFFFGTQAGDVSHTDSKLPVWIDNGAQRFYGIPGNQWRGFKIADDTRGPYFDPDQEDRRITDKSLSSARSYLDFRFPAMKGAPLVESRVCQYENTRDEDFIVDRHPEGENVWLVGGGSGHGFKHGPALGAVIAAAVMEKKTPPAQFGLKRFSLARIG